MHGMWSAGPGAWRAVKKRRFACERRMLRRLAGRQLPKLRHLRRAAPLAIDNQLGSAARNHMSRRIGRSCNDPRHDGRVGHAQSQKAVYAELRVDNREIIQADFACADAMSEARRPKPGKLADILGGRLGAGHGFDRGHTVKGVVLVAIAYVAPQRVPTAWKKPDQRLAVDAPHILSGCNRLLLKKCQKFLIDDIRMCGT
jgi:hypothetical protein